MHARMALTRLRARARCGQVLSRGEKLDLLVDKTDNLMFEVGGGARSGVRGA